MVSVVNRASKPIHLIEMHMAQSKSTRGCTQRELPTWGSCWSKIKAMVFIWSCPEVSGMGEGSTLSNPKRLVAWVSCEVVLSELLQDVDFRKNVLSGELHWACFILCWSRGRAASPKGSASQNLKHEDPRVLGNRSFAWWLRGCAAVCTEITGRVRKVGVSLPQEFDISTFPVFLFRERLTGFNQIFHTSDAFNTVHLHSWRFYLSFMPRYLLSSKTINVSADCGTLRVPLSTTRLIRYHLHVQRTELCPAVPTP